MDLSVLIQGFNEEKQLPRLFAPLKDVKDIVFIDHQSTDNTAKVAKSLGARVIRREFLHDIVTIEDRLEFKKRFGFDPQFQVNDKILRSCDERYAEGKHTKNDWILNLDCDEIITWDYEKVKSLLPTFDVINCKFFHNRNPDGSRMDWFQITKLYNRKKTWWIGRAHEVVTGYDLKVGWSDDMEIDHYHEVREGRKKYIDYMEYAVVKDGDLRAFYYLGKEYYHYGYWAQAIKILSIYLLEAYYVPEKVRAYVMMGECFWNLGREEEAWVYCMQALKINPAAQETYTFLSKIAPKKHEKIWLQHASLATNDHLL